jgi:sarcosine oxidase
MSERNFDAIVVGLGAMGSAAAYHLGRRGQRVLGLEQFGIPHSYGSSHGVNRIIRLAYYEDPSYVPLLRRSFDLWRELQADFGEQLLHVTGSLDIADRDHFVFRESLRSCEVHDLPHEVLTAAEVRDRYPAFELPPAHMAVFQADGGYVMSERAIVAHVMGALAAGAEIHGQEPVLSWSTTSTGVRVETSKGSYFADHLVLSTGAWMGSMLPDLAPLFRPERQVLGWFQPDRPEWYTNETMPVFNLGMGEERYYGFPICGIPGFKFGKYHHRFEEIDPNHWDRNPGAEDEAVLRDAIRAVFPTANGPILSMSACMFTNTPDEHFVIDRLAPGSPVIVASPCSGHGYKFAAVIGEILADLVTKDGTEHNIDLFKLSRFSG